MLVNKVIILIYVVYVYFFDIVLVGFGIRKFCGYIDFFFNGGGY